MNISIRPRATIAFGTFGLLGSAVFAILPGRHYWPLTAISVLTGAVAVCFGLVCLRRGRIATGERMSRADRARWAQARTLADVGELTAQWLEGAIVSQPGYCGPSDIENPELVPLLARLNRAGFVTTGSQAGGSGPGFDGAHWEQRSAVEGFADARMASRFARAARAAGMTVVVYCPAELPRWRYGYSKAVPVTMRAGRDYTRFGVQVPRGHVRSPHLGYGVCNPDAVKALCGAWQVTLIDPEWARPDVLWCVLEQAIRPGGSTS